MIRSLKYLAIVFVFISCQKESPFDGIWVTAYTQTGNGKALPSYSRNLMEFGDTSVLVTSIGNFATGDLSEVSSIRLPFQFLEKEEKIILAGDQYNYQIGGDSIALTPFGAETTKIVFRKLGAEFQGLSKPEISGFYSLSSSRFTDTLNFKNDTLVEALNQMNPPQFPYKKWSIRSYKGYYFFNLENDLFGLAPIKSAIRDEIVLYNSINENSNMVLKRLEKVD